jgi:zinc D-Ala-D-Ala carboxypeptidase
MSGSLLMQLSMDFANLTHPRKSGRTGYEEEKWHWSYLPLSGEFLDQYVKQVTYADIKGFAGSEVAKSMQVITRYVEGVACKKQ